MSKKACKKKNFEDKQQAKYSCKKCGARVMKKDKVCKPQKNLA
jgi:DNA-directed RNA polymerase subunit RPC12/RpoP